jgi:serine/threonine protein kinase
MSSTAKLVAAAVLRGHLGRFHSLQVIGRGGFGFVLRAEDSWLKRMVALKVPMEQTCSLDLLLHEARILASLNHPHILTIYSAEAEACTQDRELRFFVMEYMPGGDLATRILAGRLSPRRGTPQVPRRLAVRSCLGRVTALLPVTYASSVDSPCRSP